MLLTDFDLLFFESTTLIFIFRIFLVNDNKLINWLID